MVLQEPFLFFGTAGENVACGKPEATRAEILAVGGASASSSDAPLIDPRALILDEAISSVDTKTERESPKALDDQVPVRTFPVVGRDEGIAIVNTEGRELAWIDRLADRAGGARAQLIAGSRGVHHRIRDATFARPREPQDPRPLSVTAPPIPGCGSSATPPRWRRPRRRRRPDR